MLHRSEQVPSGVLTVIIAAAAILLLLAMTAGTGPAASNQVAAKSIVCVLAVLTINRIGVMSGTTSTATILLLAVIILENPFFPLGLSAKYATWGRLASAAVFALAAFGRLRVAALARSRTRASLQQRSARVDFRN